MNHTMNEHIYFSGDHPVEATAKKKTFLLEMIAFGVTVVFLLLLTAIFTMAYA